MPIRVTYSIQIDFSVQGELLNAPCTGPIQDLTMTYFNNIIAQKCSAVIGTRNEAKKILDTTNNFLK